MDEVQNRLRARLSIYTKATCPQEEDFISHKHPLYSDSKQSLGAQTLSIYLIL